MIGLVVAAFKRAIFAISLLAVFVLFVGPVAIFLL